MIAEYERGGEKEEDRISILSECAKEGKGRRISHQCPSYISNNVYLRAMCCVNIWEFKSN